jgi:hypothetical protein
LIPSQVQNNLNKTRSKKLINYVQLYGRKKSGNHDWDLNLQLSWSKFAALPMSYKVSHKSAYQVFYSSKDHCIYLINGTKALISANHFRVARYTSKVERIAPLIIVNIY